ncbi:MAG: c-type cytochrome [Verrucomicrobia bacterium]|nr:c-type cytochrome [Verrucomicrobiota bacterium]
MKQRFWFVALALGIICAANAAAAPEPEVEAKDLPRLAPTEPDKALATFHLKPGFRIELAAAEPLVNSPVAMSFDENGRLYVVEMIDYSERRDEHLGRIRLLEDTDGDGRFDKATVFADNLPWPTAVICYGGGVFVGATPDVLFLKDTNGDSVADVREIVFTGFGQGVARLNVQQLVNSFNWGLDNRIHGANGGNGGAITSAAWPKAKPLDIRGRDFAFDPRARAIFSESGGGQYGLSFDNAGRKFVCSNSSHIRAVMAEERYLARNPFFAAPSPTIDIAVDGPAAEVFRTSPDEAWRVIRTKWRVTGKVPGLIEGGGRPSGYFTGATGITIYRGDLWRVEFLNDAFVADCGSNLIHRKKVRPDGIALKAERPADELKTEFLTSTDNWFRPVQMANGPDGALYVADMYREVIEHPWSLPESIKKHLDLNSGNDRGRIWRIVPENFQRPKPVRLGQATTRELVATLEHATGWRRDTAARLLYERQDKTAIPALEKLLRNSKAPLGRLHALHALDGLRALKEWHALTAMNDLDAVVREHGVLLSEKLLPKFGLMSLIWKKWNSLAADPVPRVRYQLAFTLGEIRHAEKARLLAQIARRDGEDSWMRVAILSSVATEAGEFFENLVRDDSFASLPGKRDFLQKLVSQVGARGELDEIARVINHIPEVKSASLAFELTRSLGDSLQRKGGSLERSDSAHKLNGVFTRAASIAKDANIAEAERVPAIQLLGLGSYAGSGNLLLALVGSDSPQVLQLAALTALAHFPDGEVAGELVKRWPRLTPRVRSEALTLLVTRTERIGALLGALESGVIQPAELATTQIQFLCDHRDAALRQRATKIFGRGVASQRQSIIERFSPALQLPGNPEKGRATYLARCASCHRVGGQGFALGPDLASVKSSGREKLLLNLLDPNREVAPQYVNYVVETKTGETVLGLIGSESASSLTLRRANGEESSVLRSNVERIQSVGLSVMPEGLEVGLSAQDMADLLEFIATAE